MFNSAVNSFRLQTQPVQRVFDCLNSWTQVISQALHAAKKNFVIHNLFLWALLTPN